MKEIVEALLQDVEITEAFRQHQRRKAEEETRRRERRRREEEEEKRERFYAVRLRTLKEERERRELEKKLQKATWEANRRMKKAKQEKIDEYMGHYKTYDAMKRVSKLISDPQIKLAWDETYKKVKENWPSPYNKCNFTEMERTAFVLDPYQSAMWISLLNKTERKRNT